MRFWCTVAFLNPSQLLGIARACEEAGFEGIMVADHVVCPAQVTSRYPYAADGSPPEELAAPWPDPWVAISAMAAVTTSLRFSTNIYIAPARHPLVVAKAVSTAATLSNGRVALGAGVGWMREDVEAAGQDFSTRGRRLDEMIDMLRQLWTGEIVEHHGRFYDHGAIRISPVPPEPIPIYIGGESDSALRRAARADGWIGSVYDSDTLVGHLASLARLRKNLDSTRRTDFEVIVSHPGRLHDLDTYRRLEDMGVTGVMCAPWMSRRDPGPVTASDLRSRLESFAERVIVEV